MILTFDGRELKGLSKKIEATCLVRNELNGWRRKDQVVYSMGQTVPHGVAYYPRPFPPGTWEITRIVPMGQNTEYWPVFLDTSAVQEVTSWSVKDGQYHKPEGKLTGKGYGIHHARYLKGSEYVFSNTTLGCINVVEPDIMQWLADEVATAFDYKMKVYVKVLDWGDWKL